MVPVALVREPILPTLKGLSGSSGAKFPKVFTTWRPFWGVLYAVCHGGPGPLIEQDTVPSKLDAHVSLTAQTLIFVVWQVRTRRGIRPLATQPPRAFTTADTLGCNVTGLILYWRLDRW